MVLRGVLIVVLATSGSVCAAQAVASPFGNSQSPRFSLAAVRAGEGSGASSQPISVLSYGADPTCARDSTAAIDNAVAAAATASKEVYFPAGCYAHDNLIQDPGITLLGVGDQTEIRATGGIVTYRIASWSVGQRGVFTLNVSGNTQVYAGAPITVTGLSGYVGSCDPNGKQFPVTATPTVIAFMPSSGLCTSGKGDSGSVANREPNSAIFMRGVGPELRNLKITTTYLGERTGNDYSAAVLNVATHFVVDHVHIVGSAGVGYQCQGCSDGSETNNIVEETRADGFYHSGCAGNINSANNIARNTGDDSFSVNSYQKDRCLTHDIAFQNDVSINSHARGFEVDGGENISYTGGSVTNTRLTCIFIHGGSGAVYKTTPATSISVTGVVFSECRGPGVYIAGTGGENYPVTRVTIADVTGTNLDSVAVQLGDGFGGRTTELKVLNSSFTAASPETSPGILVVGAKGITLTDDTFRGFGQNCVLVKPLYGDGAPLVGTNLGCDGKRKSLSVMRP